MRITYDNIDEVYRDIQARSCGRQACSVVILVANEVDAITASKIFTQVLRSDNISYKIRPVSCFSRVIQAVQEFEAMEIRTVVLLNCGVVKYHPSILFIDNKYSYQIYNIPKCFNIDRGGDLRVYILDNHRPIHLANIHSPENVIVLDEVNYQEGFPSDGSDLDSDTLDIPSDKDEEEDGSTQESDDEISDEDDEDGDEESEAEFLDDEDQILNGVRSKAMAVAEGSEADADEEDNNDEFEEDNEDNDGVENNSDIVEQGVGDEDVGDENQSTDRANRPTDTDRVIGDTTVDPNLEQEEASNPEVDPMKEDDSVGEGALEEEPEEVEEDEEVEVHGRRRRSERDEEMEKRKRRRRNIRNYYAAAVHYSVPTSVRLIDLIKLLNKPCSSDTLWMAMLGLTDQYLCRHITEELYDHICDAIKAENPTQAQGSWRSVAVGGNSAEGEPATAEEVMVSIPNSEAGQVFCGSDLRFFMYRHWSLFESMLYSPYSAVKMGLWKGTEGAGQLQVNHTANNYTTLFAKVGMPLQEVQQLHQFMDPVLRGQFQKLMVGEAAQSCNLKGPLATFKSFYRCVGFRTAIAASDVVLAASAILEAHTDANAILPHSNGNNDGAVDETGLDSPFASRQSLWIRAFNDAYDCLCGGGAGNGGNRATEILKKGVELAISFQKALVTEAASLLDGGRGANFSSTSRIVRLKGFRYAYVNLLNNTNNNSTTNGHSSGSGEGPFTKPQTLTRLARFVMDIQVESGKWTGKNALPLVLLSEKRNTYLVVGVSPPSAAFGSKNLQEICFRKLFNDAARKETRHSYRSDAFDGSVIEIDRDHVTVFIENLMEVVNMN